MRNSFLVTGLALVAGLGACHSSSPANENPSPAYKASGDSVAAAGSHRIQLQSENNSGITGTATLIPAGSDTRVQLTLMPPAGGTAAGRSHVAHIHTGTCSAPGPVVAPLGTISATGETYPTLNHTVNIPMATLMDGQHIVAAHATEVETSATIACAPLSGM